jgi:PAS domain S-box-containing protein
VTEVLDASGQSDLVESATLLVSELVTNAILHARTEIEVAVAATRHGLYVGVTDRHPQLPSRRGYDRAATTGRGLGMVDAIATRSGTEPHDDGGKTVWFELGSETVRHATAPASSSSEEPQRTIALIAVPLRLARAWQQHCDALMREHLLACWDLEGDVDARLAEHALAGEAFAEVAAAIDAADGDSTADITLSADAGTESRFAALGTVLDQVVAMAERDELLAPPTQPEIRQLRSWICTQVREQLASAAPTPWAGLGEAVAAQVRPVDWDATPVLEAAGAVIAADDANRILAASRSALDLLGWAGADLVGERIVRIIPHRLREDHVAAFTDHLITGATTILDRMVRVPALRRDGSEVTVDLAVRRESAAGGRTVFVATMTQAS